MRHRIQQRKLNRTMSHRRALRRNLAQSLFEHGEVTTTLAKAKDAQPFVEKMITLAKRAVAGSVPARRRLVRMLGDRAVIPADHREAYNLMLDAKRARVLRARSGRRHRTGEPHGGLKFTAESIVRRLVETVAPNFMDRPGGYTRVLKLGKRRLGDAAPTATLQLVGEEQGPGSLPRPEKSARKRRTERRYAAMARLLKGGGKADDAAVEESPVEEPASPEATADESATDPATESAGDGAKGDEA